MDALAAAAVTETYLDVEKLLHDVVWKFQRRYGGSHEDLMAEARLCFMYRYSRANPVFGAKWTTWLTRKVWYALTDYMDRSIKQVARYPQGSQKENEKALQDLRHQAGFDLKDWLGELSDDARLVALMALEPPPDLLADEKARNAYKREDGGAIEMAVIEVLRDLGWATARIFESFEEIRKALSS